MSTRAVLAIDTAGPLIGAAVVSEVHPTIGWEARISRGADAALLPAIADLLEQLDHRGDTLVGVAVSVGPGAFTGLRVGLAAALGIAVARGVPVFPEGALRARSRLSTEHPVLALLDARKGRFYGQLFHGGGTSDSPVDQEAEVLLASLPDGVVAVGEGAVVLREQLRQARVRVAPDADAVPCAELGRAALAGGIPSVDAAQVRLEYVRPPDAKRPVHLLNPPGERG